MKEFRYYNRGTHSECAIPNTNVIRLSWDGAKLVQSRHYVSKDGTFDEEGIVHVFDDTPNNRITPDNVAKQIHWGCCGWAAGGHQIWQLKETVAEFLLTKPTEVLTT